MNSNSKIKIWLIKIMVLGITKIMLITKIMTKNNLVIKFMTIINNENYNSSNSNNQTNRGEKIKQISKNKSDTYYIQK